MANLRAVKRSLLPIATLALALLGATVALAAYESGTYAGKTTGQKLAISFKATQSRLSKLSLRVQFKCTDGEVFQTPLTDFEFQRIVDGRYDATYRGSTKASTYRHRGTISGRTATGSFTGTRRYNTNDDLDPNGTIVCRTGLIRYAIKKKVAKPKRR
jgi:hypothetical protein